MTGAETDPRAAHDAAWKAEQRQQPANGHDLDWREIKLVRFEDMRPRLGDGYLIKHLLGSTAMVLVYGESGTGKTFFVLHGGLCVASGGAFFGRRVRQAGVIYIAAEAGRGIENRVAAAKLEFEFPKVMPFAAIVTPIDLRSDTADLEKLLALIRAANIGMPVELIIVDTLSRVMGGGNENQPDDMGAIIRNIDRLRAETGAAVLVVHHSGKEISRGARGHSSLRAAIDTEIEITRDNGLKIATARVTKQRELPTDGALSFALRSVRLGTDEDGDPITSCVVEPADVAPAAKRPGKLPAAARVGLEQLKNCSADQSVDLPPSAHIPAGIRGVTLTFWRNHLEKAGVINPEGNPREQFRRIRVTLQKRGYIGVWDNLVWLSHRVT